MSAITCAACGESLPEQSALCPSCGEPPLLQTPRGLEWLLLKPLGRGNFGCTHEAASLDGALRAAIKEIPLAHLDLKQRELLDREVEVLSLLRHPCIPTLHEHFSTGKGRDRRAWLVLELVPGRTLRAEMSAERHSLPEVLAILAGVLEILVYLHELEPPIVHRDLKPENLIRHAETGRWKLVDFGSVRDCLKGTLGGSTVAGTFEYMAPEQFAGDASPGTDLWALGVIGVELLTRRRVASMRLDQHRFEWERHLDAPATLRLLLGRLLEPDVQKRASKARDVLVELLRLQRELPNGSHPIKSSEPRVASLKVELPELKPAGTVSRTLQALKALRVQQEEAERRAQEEQQRQEQERRDRELGAEVEKKARAARLLLERQALEEELQRRQEEREQQVAEALRRARSLVEAQAIEEWQGVVAFLAEASKRGSNWDDRARKYGIEAVSAWLEVYGALPPVIVDDQPHALSLPVAREARMAESWLRSGRSGIAWPERPAAGAALEVPLDANLGFQSRRFELEEGITSTRRFLGIPLEHPWLTRSREQEGLALAFGDTRMLLRWCPPGSFMMGSPAGERDRQGDETPMHEVRFTSGFYLGATPVTQAQYMALMGGENPSHFQGDPDLPVENLDWRQAMAFCEALSRWLGCVVRLPRESEWEYACRAGTTTRHWSGDSERALAKVGWYDKNAHGKTQPVGQKPANPWGLRDMHGNVWEWCADAYKPYSAALEIVDPTTSPNAAEGGDDPGHADRNVRGGSFKYVAGWCRSACRSWRRPESRGDVQGMRVLMVPGGLGRDAEVTPDRTRDQGRSIRAPSP